MDVVGLGLSRRHRPCPKLPGKPPPLPLDGGVSETTDIMCLIKVIPLCQQVARNEGVPPPLSCTLGSFPSSPPPLSCASAACLRSAASRRPQATAGEGGPRTQQVDAVGGRGRGSQTRRRGWWVPRRRVTSDVVFHKKQNRARFAGSISGSLNLVPKMKKISSVHSNPDVLF